MSRIDRSEPGTRKEPDGGLNRIDLALMGRGVASSTAVKLRSLGYTIGKLQRLKAKDLRRLGLNKLAIINIKNAGRPPVPTSNLIEVLFANRFMCCVCRNPKRSILVHHINPWEISKSHDVSNLSVVCELHHGKAHTKSELTRNLDAKTLRGLKSKWEKEVAKMDPGSILAQSREHGDAWVYFNHLRLFELAISLGINFKRLDTYKRAFDLGHCDRNGHLIPRSKNTAWMYEGGDGVQLYRYVRSVLTASLKKLTVANISDDFDRGTLSARLKPGDFVLIQGAHIFAKTNSREKGAGQTTTGSRRANKVTAEFTIDRWEATSSSAHNRWLSGRADLTSILKVSTLSKSKGNSKSGRLLIQGTALAIAQGFSGFKTREYATYPYRAGVYIVADDDWLDDTEDE